MFPLAGAIVSTVFFGLAPALVATRLELVLTMRGEVMRDSRPGRTRSALIILQVGASAVLLICAAVFLRSSFAAAAADVGLRTTDTILVELANERLRAGIVAAVSADPVVAAMAASWPHPLASPRSAFARTGTTRRLPVGVKLVSPVVLRRAGHRRSARSRICAGGTQPQRTRRRGVGNNCPQDVVQPERRRSGPAAGDGSTIREPERGGAHVAGRELHGRWRGSRPARLLPG